MRKMECCMVVHLTRVRKADLQGFTAPAVGCPCEGKSLGSEDRSVGHSKESSQYCLNEKSAGSYSLIIVGSNAVNVAFQLPWLQADFHTDW